MASFSGSSGTPMAGETAKEDGYSDSFVWGVATAAYQIEGEAHGHGKSSNIWDHFCKKEGNIVNGDSGEVACDHYNKLEADVKLMQEMGVKNYRFSVAWARVLPNGTGEVNEEGLAWYNKLVDCLLQHGITPYCTIYHWDHPQVLQDKFGGFLGREMIQAFVDYAEVLFNSFGDRVHHWITFNEPWCTCILGHGTGYFAPGIVSEDASKIYLSAHNILLAHAHTYKLFKDKFTTGVIGITLNANWSYPVHPEAAAIGGGGGGGEGEGGEETGGKEQEQEKEKEERQRRWQQNVEACERATLFNLGWFADPVYFGDYPKCMRERCGPGLPSFSAQEQELLKGSSDFFGLNHYSSDMVEAVEAPENAGATDDWGHAVQGGFYQAAAIKSFPDPKWSLTDMGWGIVPDGFKQLLLWVSKRYEPEGGIVVTENGCAVKEEVEEGGASEQELLHDKPRVSFLQSYLGAMREARKEGADVRGYFCWSLMDNFEWCYGYSKRFGLLRVDYATQERTPKDSFKWYKRYTTEAQEEGR